MLTFKTVKGLCAKISVDLDQQIENYLRDIEAVTGIPIPKQRIIFAGKQLDTFNTFKYYKIVEDSIIHVIESLPNGPSPNIEKQEAYMVPNLPCLSKKEWYLNRLKILNLQQEIAALELAHEEAWSKILEAQLHKLIMMKKNKETKQKIAKLSQELDSDVSEA